MSKLDTLQAFRCIGLTGVVIGHMTFAEEKYSGATLLPLAIKDFNQLFIDWFFVVSGFIMVMVSRGRFQAPREILKFVYARLARIIQAKRLLGQGCPVADAAAQCGFADQAHFSRWFRRCFGVTPGGYMAAR